MHGNTSRAYGLKSIGSSRWSGYLGIEVDDALEISEQLEI